MRMKTRLASGLMVLAGVCGMQQTASAVLFLTNTANIQIGKHQVEIGGDTTDNPNLVVNAKVGALVPITSASSSTGDLGGAFGLANLNDGDIGVGVLSDGTYAIPNNNGTTTLNLGGVKTLNSIAIYNGYGNRDNGNYTIKDGAGNVLGAYSIANTGGGSNAGVDSFWLTFKNPVTTNAIQIDSVTTDVTPSYREIQIFDASVQHNIVKVEADPSPTTPFGNNFPTIPAPSSSDLGQTGALSIVGGSQHVNSASVNVLNDGIAQDGPIDCCGAHAGNPNGVTNTFFFADEASGKIRMDFAQSKNIAEVRAFSWFELSAQDDARVAHIYQLYGSNAVAPGNSDADLLDPTQWVLLGSVNSDFELGVPRDDFQIASSVSSPTGSLGIYSHLLWYIQPVAINGIDGTGQKLSTFYSEFDVIEVIPEPATLSLLVLGGAGLMLRRRRA